MSRDDAWERQAEEWAQFARSPEHDHFFWDFNGPRFLEMVPPPGRRTLDVACGEGRLGRLLHQRGHTVVAVDASRPLARMAGAAGGQAVVVADAAHIPLADHSADLAVAFMSLQDIADLQGAVAEVARVLMPAGRFCIAIAHPLRSAGGFEDKQASSPFTVQSYFEARAWPWSSQHTGLRLTLPGIHRPLEAYTGALTDAGFAIEAMREPRPSHAQVAKHAASARWLRLPCFLHIRAFQTLRRAARRRGSV